MDRGESTRTPQQAVTPILAIHRESYDLASVDLDTGDSNGGFKKSRVTDAAEHRLRENGASNAVGLSQALGVMEGSHRAKRRSRREILSCELIKGDEEGLEYSSPSTRAVVGHAYCEPLCREHTTIIHGSQEQHGHSEQSHSGDMSLIIGSRESALGGNATCSLYPSWVTQTSAGGPSFSSNLDVAGTSNFHASRHCWDGSLRNRDSRASLSPVLTESRKGKGSIVDCESGEVQTALDYGYPVTGGIASESSVRASNRSHLDTYALSYSSSLFTAEDEAMHSQSRTLDGGYMDYTDHNRHAYMYGGNVSCKRRLSSPGLADTAIFEPSQVSPAMHQSLSSRIVGNGTSGFNLNDLSFRSNETNGASLVLPARHLHNGRHNVGESFRTSIGEASLFTESESTHPVYHSSLLSVPREDVLHSHSLFARNLRRSLPPARSHRLAPLVLADRQQIVDESITNTTCSSDGNHRSSTSNARSANTPIWGGTSTIRRGNSTMFSTPDGRESASSAFEGLHYRGLPRRIFGRSAGQVVESRQPSQNGGDMGTNERDSNQPDGGVQPGLPSSVVFNSNRDLPSHSPPRIVTRNHGAPRLHSGDQNIFGIPVRSFHMLPAHREQRQRFLSEILLALEHAWRSDDLSYEELVILDPFLSEGFNSYDRYSDMRLDVDNMSYEELLALGERIGSVSTGLSEEAISLCLRESKYSSLDATLATISQESDVKCTICQDEFVEDDELGRLDCGHGYHTECIKHWLVLKNQCPICKAPASSKPT